MTILNLDLLYPCLTTAPGWPSVHPGQMLGKMSTENPEGALESLSYSRVPGCSWAKISSESYSTKRVVPSRYLGMENDWLSERPVTPQEVVMALVANTELDA